MTTMPGLVKLTQHQFPANQPITEAFLNVIGGITVAPDVVVIPLPVVAGGDKTQFGLQLQRLAYVAADTPKDIYGASIWVPSVQATGLPAGAVVCPILSSMLMDAQQLEMLLVGMGCSVLYRKKGETDGQPATDESRDPIVG